MTIQRSFANEPQQANFSKEIRGVGWEGGWWKGRSSWVVWVRVVSWRRIGKSKSRFVGCCLICTLIISWTIFLLDLYTQFLPNFIQFSTLHWVSSGGRKETSVTQIDSSSNSLYMMLLHTYKVTSKARFNSSNTVSPLVFSLPDLLKTRSFGSSAWSFKKEQKRNNH